MNFDEIKFEIGRCILAANYFSVPNAQHAVLIIHGGGLSPRQADHFLEFQHILATYGVASLAFNHCGIQPSDGHIEKSSLAVRLNESRTALNVLSKITKINTKEIMIMGNSMGGYEAAILARSKQSRGLILSVPAAYIASAHNVPFGPKFTKEIKREKDWRTVVTLSFGAVSQYKGDLLIVAAEKDYVVDRSITDRYNTEAVNAKSKIYYIIKGAPHNYFVIPKDKWRQYFYKECISWLKRLSK